MVYERFVEVGRVAFIAYGPQRGKLCVILDIIDQNRALVEGPFTGIKRQSMNFKHLHLTSFTVKIGPSARQKSLKKAWLAAEIDQKWKETTWAKKFELKKKRKTMTDFDRFKLMKAKQTRNRIITMEFKKLKKADAKAVKTPAKKTTKKTVKK
ncbi:large ribosomal subunit protein eL14-like [Tubulanus polymorphus]|uniref:large ribosomal subunit protein eL14-like n=1 Tax=Tubulanus polymorphus TaxID=672921 RepID=UPI003DA3B51C